MDAELVITGLCSILNPFGDNPPMSDPGVVVVNTSGHGPQHDHIGYLAYDSRSTAVSGAPSVISVPHTPFFYFPISGYELVIKGITAGPPKPTADNSFRDLVAHRDEYWPEAIGDFDRDVVPAPGNRPKKDAVKAWMRFGKGTIGASRLSEVPWHFTNANGGTLWRKFAEEVVYKFFVPGTEVVVELHDLDTEDLGATLTFNLRNSASTEPLRLMLGNNMQDDLPQALFREITKHVEHPYSTHFAFLHQTAKEKDGPIPVAINPLSNGGGGGSGGICGPGSGNGRPTSVVPAPIAPLRATGSKP